MGAAAMSPPYKPIAPGHFDAVLFDLDGVLTSTAKIHSRCWKTMFDEFLSRRATEGKEPFRPFDLETDYKLYVDGRPRYEGVRSFLASRNISLSEGTPEDRPTADTVCGLGNCKDALVKAAIDRGEVEPYPGSVALVRRLREQGIRTAVVSSSNNCEEVLRAAGILDLFETRVDGLVASQRHLPGKPAPDTVIKAGRTSGARPARAVRVETDLASAATGSAA